MNAPTDLGDLRGGIYGPAYDRLMREASQLAARLEVCRDALERIADPQEAVVSYGAGTSVVAERLSEIARQTLEELDGCGAAAPNG